MERKQEEKDGGNGLQVTVEVAKDFENGIKCANFDGSRVKW